MHLHIRFLNGSTGFKRNFHPLSLPHWHLDAFITQKNTKDSAAKKPLKAGLCNSSPISRRQVLNLDEACMTDGHSLLVKWVVAKVSV